MSEYCVDVFNNTYKLSQIKGDPSAFFQGRNNRMELTEKGDYVPIYDIFREFYKSDKVEYVQDGSYYYCGLPLFLSNVTENSQYIGALVIEKFDNTQRTQAERIAEIENGHFTYSSLLNVYFRYYQYDPSYDYTKYIFYRNLSGRTWHNAGGVFQSNNIDLIGDASYHDNEGTALGNTLLLPAHFTWIDAPQGQCCFGFIGSLKAPSSLLNGGDLDDMIVSEDSEDFCAYARDNTETYGYYYQSLTQLEALAPNINPFTDFTSGYEPYIPPEYPFEEDYNGGGGGTGDYRDTSDTISLDGVPTNSAIASGFINAYLLTQAQCQSFHDYLYSNDFLTNVKKLMNDPIDYIISFSLAPYTPDTSASTNIMIGGTDSEVNASRISSGYKSLSCGSIQLKEFWGKFYDYNPYTKVQIYLPFIGVRPLDIDDVMAGTVALDYRIDVMTGDCVASVSVNNARGTNGAIYHFNGNCHSQIPVSGKNSLETILNMASAGVGMAGAIARGDVVSATGGILNVAKASKETIEHAGELTGATGLLANFTPFLMVSRPSQSLAQNYNHYHGFISNVTAQLGTLSGYTEVAELVQTDIHCTLDEFEEINTLLKEGVYL